jgi:hypothetical protein
MFKERLSVIVWEYGGRNGKKAAKPRCFKNLKINNLPVISRNNKKACMTAATMEEWLNMFNEKMRKENRNAILFLDNATCHPMVTLSNMKIAWFSANATSEMCYLHIQIPLMMISVAIFDLECRRS